MVLLVNAFNMCVTHCVSCITVIKQVRTKQEGKDSLYAQQKKNLEQLAKAECSSIQDFLLRSLF